MSFLTSELAERLLFTIVVIGLLLGLYSAIKIVNISTQLNSNTAQQFHDSGEALDAQTTAEGRGLMTADIERRRLIQERGQMIFVAGLGIVLLGVGWLGYDLRNSRRNQEDEIVSATQAKTG